FLEGLIGGFTVRWKNGAPADGINRYRYPQDQTRISMLTYRCVRFKRSDHTSLPGDAPGGNRDCLFHLISDISRDLDPFFPKRLISFIRNKAVQ
ncbi:hypothetical protein WFJ45_17035, partial [Salmonella enterica subsp. enterica serovar Minnesota]|uniref:hypothetical protein n=3 Tax=Salmonella enterica TaxID=28901 RepID=UPI003D2D8C06